MDNDTLALQGWEDQRRIDCEDEYELTEEQELIQELEDDIALYKRQIKQRDDEIFKLEEKIEILTQIIEDK